MTKQEFVDKIAERANLGRRDAQNAVDAVLDTITETLKGRGEITFTGFGKFSTQPEESDTRKAAQDAASRVAADLGGAPPDLAFVFFSTQHRAERQGVNPRNPTEKVTIPASVVPKFSAGSSLKTAVRGR